MESEVITMQEIFEFKVDEVTSDRVVVDSLRTTGLRPAFLHKFEKRGVALPVSLFTDGRAQRGPTTLTDIGRAASR